MHEFGSAGLKLIFQIDAVRNTRLPGRRPGLQRRGDKTSAFGSQRSCFLTLGRDTDGALKGSRALIKLVSFPADGFAGVAAAAGGAAQTPCFN